MIDCIFTVDYEIYGDGRGSLRELVYEPTERLRRLFDEWGVHLVAFVEAVELDRIEEHGADDAIEAVREQIGEMYDRGHEIGLHLHPQWSNARRQDEKWILDYRDYNLCALPEDQIERICGRAIEYLRNVLDDADFTPLSFRAGNWLFQPTATAAGVLAANGIRIDSSVFKGGVQGNHGLDYRAALKNGYYWNFREDVNVANPQGELLEIPVYTEMVPAWRMATRKRLALQSRSAAPGLVGEPATARSLGRIRDFFRLRYPRKLDFCRMNIEELVASIDHVIADDRRTPALFKPIVAIGHTKDLMDLSTVAQFLSYLRNEGIAICTLAEALRRCQ